MPPSSPHSSERRSAFTPRRLAIAAALILGTILLDQTTKLAVLRMNLPAVWNEGFSWGVGDPAGVSTAVTAAAVVSIAGFFAAKRRTPDLAWSLILGGGVSNLADRILRPGVLDFISIGNFPSFNVADVAITLGAALLILETSPRLRRFLRLRD